MLTMPAVSCLRAQSAEVTALHEGFKNPPPDTRIMMRWWWFGPAVSRPELTRELEQMKGAGIGGVEIANLYALRLDDPSTGFHNQRFLSDEHLAMLRYAADEARRLRLRVDVTLGSGWPFGGPHIPVTQNAGVLRSEMVARQGEESSIALPIIGAGERLIAAFGLASVDETVSLATAKQIPLGAMGSGRMQLVGDAPGVGAVLFFIASRTGMVVKRPSVGAEGFVMDHYDSAAIANHLHTVGDRLLQGFPGQPPYAVFSDSLEVAGSDWTGDLLEEFRTRRGYDLVPNLPKLLGPVNAENDAVRHDWGKTLTEIVDERYMKAVQAWAHEHHTQFRSQTYGNPPVTLNSYRYADLIEGEGQASPTMWREFSWTRWAASAGHLFGKNVVSSETWTWLHSPSFRAVPIDMKAEADLHFLQGINQLVGHGWPYSPEGEMEPGQRMYAAAAFNAYNPWFFAMPEVTQYLQRVSFALRQGEPVADVALYMPNDDAWASFHAARAIPSTANPSTGTQAPGAASREAARSTQARVVAAASGWGNVSVDESIKAMLDKKLIGTVLDAGFSVDFIDPAMIDRSAQRYPVLVLPNVHRIELPVYRAIERYGKAGGLVIAVGTAPSLAPGRMEQEQDGAEVAAITQRLFAVAGHPGYLVADDAELAATLARFAKPEVRYASPQSAIGFLHRRLPQGELYFVANTSNTPQRLQASFAHEAKRAEMWDAFTGTTQSIKHPEAIDEMIEPYGSRLLYFSDSLPPAAVATPSIKETRVQMDLSAGWTRRIRETAPEHLDALRSWTEDPRFRFYSGSADYERAVTIGPGQLGGGPLYLDFGAVSPIEPKETGRVVRTMALLDTPVRDVAEVWVNDRRAGVVWHPPYRIDVAPFLHPGSNTIRVRVANTAINELAGEKQPDYRLLRDLYGNTFQPQDMDNLEPLPSGIVGMVTLHSQ